MNEEELEFVRTFQSKYGTGKTGGSRAIHELCALVLRCSARIGELEGHIVQIAMDRKLDPIELCARGVIWQCEVCGIYCSTAKKTCRCGAAQPELLVLRERVAELEAEIAILKSKGNGR